MTTGHDPTLVGAFLLGTLEPEQRAEVESHLQQCAQCRDELAELQELPALLDRVSVDDLRMPAIADDALFGRVVAAIEQDAEQRQHRRRRQMQAVAAAVLIAGGGTVGGVLAATAGNGTATFVAASGPVHMSVTLTAQHEGTGLAVTVDGLRDGVHCRLLAVSRGGSRQLAGTWTASYSGTAHVSGLSTSIDRSQLSEVVLQISGSRRPVVAHTT